MIKEQRITVSSTAIQLNYADDAYPGSRIFIRNSDSTNGICLGGSDVTAANGYYVGPGVEKELALGVDNDMLYGIRAGAVDVVVHVLQTGV